MNFKKLALAKVLTDKDLSTLLKLKIEYFTDRNSKFIYKTLKSYVTKFNKIPSVEVLSAAIESHVDRDKATIYIGYLEGLTLVDGKDISYEELEAGLSEDSIVRAVDVTIAEIVEAAQAKDSEALKQLLTTLNEKVFTPSIEVQDAKDVAFSIDNIQSVDCYLDTIKLSGTQLFGVVLISGSSGGGKSIWALNQAIHSYNQGLDILYINLELGGNEQMARMLSHIDQKPFGEIYTPNLSQADLDKYNARKREYFSKANKFKMINANAYKSDIISIIRDEAKSGLELVVLDYIQLVGNDSMDKDWQFISNLVKDLHRLSLELGIVIITPIQINAADVKEEQNEISLTTRGSRELEFSSSLWFHIHQSREEYAEKVARLFTIKSRHSDKKIYMLSTVFDKMSFEDTGVML